MSHREDCWSEGETSALVDAWGDRYIELNRGNIRQKQWQEVANAVNLRHGAGRRVRRTDVQCKNRVDTLKKKYKIEKVKISSQWPFFSRMEMLFGSSLPLKKPNFLKREICEGDGVRELARGIDWLAEIYEKVEGEKSREMIEIEKKRMEFLKGLEFQRMQMFVDAQVQLEKMKRIRRADDSKIEAGIFDLICVFLVSFFKIC